MFFYFLNVKNSCAGLRTERNRKVGSRTGTEESLKSGLSLRSGLTSVSGNICGVTGNTGKMQGGIREVWDSIKQKGRAIREERSSTLVPSLFNLVFCFSLTLLLPVFNWRSITDIKKRAVQVAGKSKPLYICYENGRFFKQGKKISVHIFHAFAVGASSHSNLPRFEQSFKYFF